MNGFISGTAYLREDLKNVDGMENHLDRQEVKEALEKGEGSAIRYSESLGQEMLYVAKLSEDGKAIIRMSIPYTGLFRYMIVVLPLLLVGMIVAFVVSVADIPDISTLMKSNGRWYRWSGTAKFARNFSVMPPMSLKHRLRLCGAMRSY